MKKFFFALVLLPTMVFAISFEASNNISGQGDSIYVNSPTESVAQTFTSSLTVTGNAFSVGGSTLVVSGGKVGFGITPSYKLHIVGAADEILGYFTDNTNTGVKVSAGANGGKIAVDASTAFQIGDGTDVNMVVLGTNGNVGISTSAPSITLDVQGQMGAKNYTLAQMELLVPGRAGALIAISDSVAPYTYCVSTGTAVAAWVKLNTADHCQ